MKALAKKAAGEAELPVPQALPTEVQDLQDRLNMANQKNALLEALLEVGKE